MSDHHFYVASWLFVAVVQYTTGSVFCTLMQDAKQIDLEKMAFVDCFETSDVVNISPYELGISPLTDYIRKVSLQPAELWLASTPSSAVDSIEVVSPEVRETSAVSGFVHYVEAVSAEPLEYWLCPSCELEFPSTDEASFGDVAAESVNFICTEPESNVASVTLCLQKILCKPDSFWLISYHNADRASNNSVKLNSSLCSPLCVPHFNAVFTDPQLEQGNVHACDFWLPKSSYSDDETGVVISDANDISVNFSLESAIRGCPSEKIASNFSNDYYIALLKSKPLNDWLCNGDQKLPE